MTTKTKATKNDEGVLLPRPLLWRILVEPRRAESMSAGGIVIPGEATDAENAMCYVGRIVELGSLCYQSKTQGGVSLADETQKPKVGDWVIYRQHAGQRIRAKSRANEDGRTYLLLEDKDILAVVDDPDQYWSWIL